MGGMRKSRADVSLWAAGCPPDRAPSARLPVLDDVELGGSEQALESFLEVGITTFSQRSKRPFGIGIRK
jgi:hypothetical protein